MSVVKIAVACSVLALYGALISVPAAGPAEAQKAEGPAAAEPVAVSSVVLAANVLVTAPLPPGRPMDLGLTRKTASASPEARDLRFAALMPESRSLRGSLRQH